MRASLSAILSVLSLALLAATSAGAEEFSSLGYREDTVIESDGRDECIGTLVYNHDYSFENAYCWQGQGIESPYYGAFGEAFDVGPADVECAVYWLTQIGYGGGPPLDAYVWDGGIATSPGGVLYVVPSVTGLYIGFWPECTMNEVEIGCCVSGDFTVGYWSDFSVEVCWWYCCADENGSGGRPWTCIAPGIGYPSGWQHPNVVWPNCRSLGIGVTIMEEPSPVESVTWGAIKSLFQR